MVNKQGIWFLTLTSLALVLSVYYITMPNELLLTNNSNYNDTGSYEVNNETSITITESELLTSMRIELDEERNLLLSQLEEKLTDSDLTVSEKNEVYENLKYISEISSKEELLEKKIKDEFELDSFVKINDDIVEVIINNTNHDKSLAVNIMKSLQEEFLDKMYISVSFK